MKNIPYQILWIFSICCCFSCENNLESYHEETNRLNFVFESFQTDSATHYTFVYEPAQTVFDTIWVEVSTMGYVTGYERPVVLKQLAGPAPQAEAGKHYVAFNAPDLTGYYVIPAGKSQTKLPVIVKRDPSLQEIEVTLTFTFEENEYFKVGYASNSVRKITISDQLSKPSAWNGWADVYFGVYGKVKHRFMINATTSLNTKIDDDFFYKLVGGNYYEFDHDMLEFWQSFFTQKLEEENAARAARDQGPLREEPEPGETEGKLVTFES